MALLLIGGVIAGVLAVQSSHIKGVATTLSGGGAAGPFIPQSQLELRATAQYLTDPSKANTAALVQARNVTNEKLAAFQKVIGGTNLSYTAPAYVATLKQFEGYLIGLPAERTKIDQGAVSLNDATSYYGNLMNSIGVADGLLGANGPDGKSASAEAIASSYLGFVSQMGQTTSLAHAAFSSNGMTEPEYQAFVRNQAYRANFSQIALELSPAAYKQAVALTNTPAWREQGQVEQAVLGSKVPTTATSGSSTSGSSTSGTGTSGTGTGTSGTGTGTSGTGDPTASTNSPAAGNAETTNTPSDGSSADSTVPVGRKAKLPIDRATWDDASAQLLDQMSTIGINQSIYGGTLARNVAQTRITQAILVGGLLLLFAVLVLVLTTRESNSLVRRLRRLQAESLDLASNRLPRMVVRLREGEKVEEGDELTPIELGRDEIGQVAEAFNYSQRVAVRAAIRESETRAGLRAVFLNIAYRSQVIVHRQLNVLERAERFQEDPEQLKLLFELDHLSTRARRNAENLVILGGGQPGRQWRNSVALLQVVRGAISEAEDYARVSIADLPHLAVTGAAVGDVIHLLAEVVDNATSFSPPMSRVEVRGNMVGRGLVLEVEDQGLGIPPDQLEQLNQMMQEPPDFHVMALREEPRLGMFVVAQLAQSHGIRVTLTPSPAYGGTRVVVLLPNELLDSHEQPASLLPGEIEEPESPQFLASPDVHSIHERMAFEGDVLAGNTGEFSLPPRREQREQREQWAAAVEPPRRAPILSVAPSGPSANYETAPRPVVSAAPSSRPGRPDLPRRSRQSHLSDRLRTASTDQQDPIESREPAGPDPDLARNRMAAFQRGTQRGRIDTPDSSA